MEPLSQSLKYRVWEQALLSENVEIQTVEELAVVRKGNGDTLFALVKFENRTPEGQRIPPIVLLRGHFVSVLTWLIDEQTGERFLMLVRQRRGCNGAYFYEHPSGMCDNDGDPYAVAIKEVKEETGVTITRDQLTPLNEELIYSSPGLLDEAGYFFYCELYMNRADIDALHQHEAGAEHENESTIVEVVTLDQAMRLIKNANGLLNIYLYLEKNSQPQ